MDYGDRPLAYYRDQGGVHPIFASYVPNDIINGALSFWQRGTSFAAVAAGAYTADRMLYSKNAAGAMVHTISRSTDVPGVSPYDVNYSLLAECTTPDTDISSVDYCAIQYRIEGFNFKRYVGGYGTLSFDVKATKTGIYCVVFRNSANDRSYVVEFAVNAANTWERKTITLRFDYSGGSWDYTNGTGLRILWVLACGSSYYTTPNAWQAGNYFTTSNQINACDTAGNLFYLARVKFEPGRVATPFVSPDYATELVRCRRYYEKSYNAEIAPGTVTPTGCIQWRANGTSAWQPDSQASFKVSKRAIPTVTAYSTVTGASANVRDVTTGADVAVSSIVEPGEGNTGYIQLGAAPTDNYHYAWHFTADAEL